MPYRVLVVEDHPAMREAYTWLLNREADLEVLGVVESAEEALALLDGRPCDLVIADVSLPGMDGIEMVGRMRARRPELAALVVSAYEGDAYVRRAREAGAHAFLSKRDLGATLPEAIRDALRGRGGDTPPGPASSE